MISVVIPTLNESESIEQLYRELDEVAQKQNYQLQIIFVDDGSTDGTWKMIEQLAQQDERVLGIRFRRNFGKAAALSAGFDATEGEVIITMDADLQDDPGEFPLLLAKMEQGFDVVSGWKQRRYDPWHKVWPSRVFNALVGKLTGVKLHDHNCGLKCYRRDVIHEVRLYGELHRFVPVLAVSRGFSVGEVVVEHRPREHGQSIWLGANPQRLSRSVDRTVHHPFRPTATTLAGNRCNGFPRRRHVWHVLFGRGLVRFSPAWPRSCPSARDGCYVLFAGSFADWHPVARDWFCRRDDRLSCFA